VPDFPASPDIVQKSSTARARGQPSPRAPIRSRFGHGDSAVPNNLVATGAPPGPILPAGRPARPRNYRYARSRDRKQTLFITDLIPFFAKLSEKDPTPVVSRCKVSHDRPRKRIPAGTSHCRSGRLPRGRCPGRSRRIDRRWTGATGLSVWISRFSKRGMARASRCQVIQQMDGCEAELTFESFRFYNPREVGYHRSAIDNRSGDRKTGSVRRGDSIF